MIKKKTNPHVVAKSRAATEKKRYKFVLLTTTCFFNTKLTNGIPKKSLKINRLCVIDPINIMGPDSQQAAALRSHKRDSGVIALATR